MLRYTRNANPDYKPSYRAPGRRVWKVNQKFSKKVAESLGHTYKISDLENEQFTAAPSQTTWIEIEVGTTAQMQTLYGLIANHAAGYKVADPNTTFNSWNQMKMHVKIGKMIRNLKLANASTVPITAKIYELVPRHDIRPIASVVGGSMSPRAIITLMNQTGNLIDTGAGFMTYSEPRFTPYMSPILTAHWKIINTRVAKIAPGAILSASVSANNNNMIPMLDGTIGELEFRKGKSKVLLIQLVGDLGVVRDAAGIDYIRHLPFNAVAKIESWYEAHMSNETRQIYSDQNASLDTGTFTGTTTHINKQQAEVVNYAQVDASSMS